MESESHKDVTCLFNEKTISYRVPTDLELWTVLQRLLMFEEPASKWSLSRKALKKQLHKNFTFEASTIIDESNLFAEVFANSLAENNDTTDSAERRALDKITASMLAYEDLQRFNELAFDLWSKKTVSSENLIDSNFSSLSLGQTECLWLQAASIAAPAWSKIGQAGPWTSDVRAKFISLFQDRIRSTAETEIANCWKVWQTVLAERRDRLPGSFLPKIILLVEGQTESLLLPAFAELLSVNLHSMAVHIEACGGAKQVVKQYLNLKELTTLPILCVLDADVRESIEIIRDSLRVEDRMVTHDEGEIEDSFSESVLFRLVNKYLSTIGCLEPIRLNELRESTQDRISTLDRLFKVRGLGSFDKIGFARIVAENLRKADVPQNGRRIIEAIQEIDHAGCALRFQ